LRCKQWSCDNCARKNQSIWRAFLRERLPEVSANWSLLTLTAASFTRTEQSSYENLKKGIDKLMKRARRVFGEIEYVRVFEKHPTSNALHAHFIISGLPEKVRRHRSENGVVYYRPTIEKRFSRGIWSAQTWFKVNAYGCGMGYQVAVSQVSLDKARFYITKYLTKDMQRITIKGLRHIQTTRAIGSPKAASEFSWEVGTRVTQFAFEPETTIIDVALAESIPPEYWKEFAFYPPDIE